ncbi:hypothetical protein C5167_025091 [Papaver somniferum]|uniref:Uncharacterized protein n=1 Tax=Papaver somniferum TaxID=3469 RepID=A0A4Y7JS37_PAPSO|nr:hypothetical protein C5167_025091 [Papaver somniferum]
MRYSREILVGLLRKELPFISGVGLFDVEKDHQVTLTAFNIKRETYPSFTASKLPHNLGDEVFISEPSRVPSPVKHEIISELEGGPANQKSATSKLGSGS